MLLPLTLRPAELVLFWNEPAVTDVSTLAGAQALPFQVRAWPVVAELASTKFRKAPHPVLVLLPVNFPYHLPFVPKAKSPTRPVIRLFGSADVTNCRVESVLVTS